MSKRDWLIQIGIAIAIILIVIAVRNLPLQALLPGKVLDIPHGEAKFLRNLTTMTTLLVTFNGFVRDEDGRPILTDIVQFVEVNNLVADKTVVRHECFSMPCSFTAEYEGAKFYVEIPFDPKDINTPIPPVAHIELPFGWYSP